MKNIVMPKKRLFMSLILVLAIALVSIVSIAVVFAATLQNTTTEIKITYVIDSVGAKISASYATVSSGTAANKTAVTNSDGTSEIEIAVSDEIDLSNVSYDTAVSTILNSTTNKVVYEYKFTNTAESAFTVGLTNTISGTNLSVAYKVSGTEIATSEYSTDFEDTSLMPQALVEQGDTIYIYVSATLTGESATFSSNSFVWELTRADDANIRTITLNNGDSTGGQTTLKFIYGTNIAMPVVYSLPTPNDDTLEFAGYFTEENGAGTQYISKTGTSTHAADLANGTTLYAYFNQAGEIASPTSYFTYSDSDETIITGLTEEGLTQTKIVIPSTITAIADSAFLGTNLQVVTYEGAEVETESYASGGHLLTSIGEYAFAESGLISIAIPNSVTSIGGSAFSDCFSLTSITFEENSQLTSIGGSAFSYCTSLTSITIPNSVTSIDASAFNNCDSLVYNEYDNAKYLGNEENPYLVFLGDPINNIYMTSCEINSNAKVLANSAFSGCSSLTSITIPSSVTSIGNNAFYNCTGLTEINWNVTKLSSELTSGNSIFYKAGYSSGAITLNIGEDVEEIPAYLFYDSSSSYRPKITSVVLPDGSTWARSTTKGATTGTSVYTITADYLLSTYYNYYFIRTDN